MKNGHEKYEETPMNSKILELNTTPSTEIANIKLVMRNHMAKGL